MTSYRYPTEQAILFLTGFIIVAAAALSAVPTLCAAPLLAGIFFLITYQVSQAHHRQLLRSAEQVTFDRLPQLASLAQDCITRLRTGAVRFYVLPSNQLNAYTFGLARPNVVVLFSPLLQVMDDTELKFVIGHELGHVALGHSWLNTLLGGMAGVPVSFSAAVILTLAFRSWNRACEFSADRAGLLACGSLPRAISALAQLEVGDINSQAELKRALAVIEQQDDSAANVIGEALATHPLIARRINELRKWAASDEYRRLAGQK